MANRIANIKTNLGTIRFELLEEDAPKTTENFIKLAERGYYNERLDQILVEVLLGVR